MSFYDDDEYEVTQEERDLLTTKHEERLEKARFNILNLPRKGPLTYNTEIVKSIYEDALKSRLVKVPKDSTTVHTSLDYYRRDWYVVLMGQVSYKFLVGKSFRQVDGSVVDTANSSIRQSTADQWSKTYSILLEGGESTSIKTSSFCQIFQRNVMPSASIGVPIGCECKDWQFRFVNTAEGKESLHNFATAGCKHMLAVEEAIREYPETIAQNSP